MGRGRRTEPATSLNDSLRERSRKVARPSDPIGLRRVGVSLPDRAGGDCRAIRLIGSYHQRSRQRKTPPQGGRRARRGPFGRVREDTEVIHVFAPPRENFLIGGKPAYMSEG
jgi:hypothetical protein